MTVSRTLTIIYGSWNSTDSGWGIDNVHEYVEDRVSGVFRCTFDATVVGTGGLPADDMVSKVQAFKQVMATSNQRLRVSYVGGNPVDLDPGTSSWTAQSTSVEIKTRERPRGNSIRSFRVTVKGTTAISAEAANKIGRRRQSYVLTTSPEGVRELQASIEFTPVGGVGNAGVVADHATYGFAQAIATYQAALGGDWDDPSAGPVRTRDEDDRFVTVSATYPEIIFNQSQSGANEPKLVGPLYSCFTDIAAAPTIEGLDASPVTTARVTFSSGVKKSETQDLNDVIQTTVLPYIRATVKSVLRLTGPLIELRNTLAGDPVANRISGAVDFEAPEPGLVLSASKEYRADGITGEEFLEVLSGEDFHVDVQKSSRKRFREVTILVEELGGLGVADEDYVSGLLAGLLDQEILDQEDLGYRPVSDARTARAVRTQLNEDLEKLSSLGAIRFRRVEVQGESDNADQEL